MLPDSVVKDVRGATHVFAYALRTTKLLNNRRSHCSRELIFVIEEFSIFKSLSCTITNRYKEANEDSEMERSLVNLSD